MSERKVRLDSERLYKNRANQGIDEMIFELSLTGKDMHDLQKSICTTSRALFMEVLKHIREKLP